MNDLPISPATLVSIAVFSTIAVFGLVWRISHRRIDSENPLKFSASPVRDVEKGMGQLLKTTDLNPTSDTLASIDQIAQDIFNRPKPSGGGKKKALSISNSGALQISVGSNSSSIERRHSPVVAEESKLDQIKVRVRSATVKNLDGEAPRFSKTAPALSRRIDTSDANNANSAQSEMSNDDSSRTTSEKSLIFNTSPLSARSTFPERKKSNPVVIEESKLDQIKVRVRSATVKNIDGEAPRLSKIAPALSTRRFEASDGNNANSAQFEISNDDFSKPTSEKSLVFPVSASSASPERKNSTIFGVEESN